MFYLLFTLGQFEGVFQGNHAPSKEYGANRKSKHLKKNQGLHMLARVFSMMGAPYSP